MSPKATPEDVWEQQLFAQIPIPVSHFPFPAFFFSHPYESYMCQVTKNCIYL